MLVSANKQVPQNVTGDFVQPPFPVVCPARATLYGRHVKNDALAATSLAYCTSIHHFHARAAPASASHPDRKPHLPTAHVSRLRRYFRKRQLVTGLAVSEAQPTRAHAFTYKKKGQYSTAI